jgi:hypothetical protein
MYTTTNSYYGETRYVCDMPAPYPRTLKYYDQVMAYTYQITHIRLVTVPNFDPAITGLRLEPNEAYIKSITLLCYYRGRV